MLFYGSCGPVQVSINALMRVLRDPSLASQHMNVIAAIMSIFKALSLQSVPYLPKVSRSIEIF